ncbi:hypothetical protein L218DRAFT_1078400 [Marasmius fiardii PR-910]|nr:hypothetical protein L218DRAFT_1078400 [Marasmius fiardii PR-910]
MKIFTFLAIYGSLASAVPAFKGVNTAFKELNAPQGFKGLDSPGGLNRPPHFHPLSDVHL